MFERTPENKAESRLPGWVLPVSIWVVCLAALGWLLFASPWLQVKYVRIEGDPNEATKAEIQKLRGQNILWLSVTNPEAAILKAQPVIKQIQLLRGIPDTLIVKLIARQSAMIWQVNDHWYTVDSTGFVFIDQTLTKKDDGSYNDPTTNLPIVVDTKNLPVKVGQVIIRPQFIRFVAALKDRLPKEAKVHLIRAEVGETTFNVTAVTDSGYNILFDTTRTVDNQMKTLDQVLDSKRNDIHQYVDVRVRGWVYYQ